MKRWCLFLLLIGTVLTAQYQPLTLKLTVAERLSVISLLPTETNFANWKVINDIKNQLSLTEEEYAKLNPKQAENGIMANWDAVPVKEITFGEISERMIVDALKELDRQSKLAPEHIPLYEKFILKEMQ